MIGLKMKWRHWYKMETTIEQRLSEQFKQQSTAGNGHSHLPIYQLKKRAFETFLQKGLPDSRDEAWKYTYLKKYLQEETENLSKNTYIYDLELFKSNYLNKKDKYIYWVLIDGKLDVSLSDCSPINGLEFNTLHSESAAQNIELPENALELIAFSLAKEHLTLHIDKIFDSNKSIQIIDIQTNKSNELNNSFINILINSEAICNIIYRPITTNEYESKLNSFINIELKNNSICNFTSIQNVNNKSYLIENKLIKQSKGSIFTNNQIALSGGLLRNNLYAVHVEQHCETNLYGLTCIAQQDHVDHNTVVDHAQPNCVSNELYKGIYDEKSTGIFNGKIIVRKDAQKTNAFQSSKNILVSDEATVNARPQLEIFADDVKCSHGCTSAQIDEKELFYLQSRGISPTLGKSMLMYAFAEDALQGIKNSDLKAEIEQTIASKLGLEW